MKKIIDFELIATIVKKGYSDYVILEAQKAGATGATVVFGFGSDKTNTQEFLGLTIQPEKEIVLIVAKKRNKKKIMEAILKSTDLKKEGSGICFSLPITNVVGFSSVLS